VPQQQQQTYPYEVHHIDFSEAQTGEIRRQAVGEQGKYGVQAFFEQAEVFCGRLISDFLRNTKWVGCLGVLIAERSSDRGKEESMSPTLSPEELKKLLDSKSVTLIDVRRKVDYEANPRLIPGAAWRDPEQVEVWSRELPKDRLVVVYCVKGGSVSQSITEILTRAQVNIRYIEGGLRAWKESGGRVE